MATHPQDRVTPTLRIGQVTLFVGEARDPEAREYRNTSDSFTITTPPN